MNRANAKARPCSDLIHDLSFMGRIVFPEGETMSSPSGNFFFTRWVLKFQHESG